MLEKGANPEHKNNRFMLPLDMAIAQGHLEIVKILFPIMNIKEVVTVPPLIAAVCENQEEVFNWLIEQKEDANEVHCSKTVLHHVFFEVPQNNPSISIIELLMQRGANINLVYGSGQDTLLGHAVRHELVPKVKLLINLGADVNVGWGGSSCPISFAIGLGNKEIISLLLNNGAVIPNVSMAKHLANIGINAELPPILVANDEKVRGELLNAFEGKAIYTPQEVGGSIQRFKDAVKVIARSMQTCKSWREKITGGNVVEVNDLDIPDDVFGLIMGASVTPALSPQEYKWVKEYMKPAQQTSNNSVVSPKSFSGFFAHLLDCATKDNMPQEYVFLLQLAYNQAKRDELYKSHSPQQGNFVQKSKKDEKQMQQI